MVCGGKKNKRRDLASLALGFGQLKRMLQALKLHRTLAVNRTSATIFRVSETRPFLLGTYLPINDSNMRVPPQNSIRALLA